jgi:hypothetical protein
MPIELSTARAPLFITTASGVLSDSEYVAHLEDCTKRILDANQIYAYVYDGTRIEKMTAHQRKLQADWIKAHEATIRRLNKGCGFAFDSIITRGLLTAVHWLTPPPYPYVVVATREAAIEWCLQKLEMVTPARRAGAG